MQQAASTLLPTALALIGFFSHHLQAAPSPRAGDVIIEDTDDDQTPNPGAEDKAKKGVRFVSLTPDILYEVDPSRYVEDTRTLAGAQLFYGARPDLLGAKVACVAPYDPVWRQELAEKKKSIVWGRLDNLWPEAEKKVGTKIVLHFWARPSTAFYAWKHPQDAQKLIAIDFTLWKQWLSSEKKVISDLTYKTPEDKQNSWKTINTGYQNTTQYSFETCPWKDMLERGRSGNTVSDYMADADRVRTWQTAANKIGRTIRIAKLPWVDDWVEHAILYNQKGIYHQKKRAVELNWGETFHQTLNETVKLYDGFLCLKHIFTLADVSKNISANQAASGHSHVIPFDARVKWSGYVKTVDKGKEVMQEKVFLESAIAKAVVISDMNASPDFVVLAVACDCIKGASAEDAITILQAFRGEEVAVAEYIAEGTISGTGGKDSPLTYATGIGYAKGTSTGNLGSFTAKNPENLRYNRSVARLRSEETAAAYKAGITPRYKILFAVKEALAADPAKLTLTGDATKTRSADGKPVALEENEGGNSLNGYTYKNMAVALNAATNITPVGSGSIELFRLPLPRVKYRLFQADVQARDPLERDIRMGFMDYTWTLRAESKELGTDSSRIGRVFAVFGESTLKCQEPTPGMYKWQLILSKSLCSTLAQSPGSDLALDGNSMDNDAMRPLRQSLLSGGFITLTVDRTPVLTCRQGSSGTYRALTEGRDYACLAIRDMKEIQPPSCERPWIDALETLTRHLLLEKRLRPFNLAWPTTADLPNAVNVFAYGMHVMTDYNPRFKTAEYRHQVLEYANEAYYRSNDTIIMELNLSKFSRKICGGDHPHVICVEAVGLSYSLLALCGMEYDSLKFLQHPSIAHALLGYGNKIYEATPSLQSPTTNRPQRTPGRIQGEVTTDPPGIRVDGEIYRNLKAILLLSTTRETP